MSVNNQQEQFMGLYSAQSDAVFRFCLIRTHERETALDITQESFLKFWKVIVRGDRIANERALLFTIARHLIIDWFRAKKSVSLDAMTENEEIPEVALPDGHEEGLKELETKADARRVLERLDELDPPYREVVYLRFVEGLRPKEIAGIIGVSVNVISVRIHRGIRALSKIAGYDMNEEKI
jgi:RNA polymerase sigma-70 factor (ECF subfamily)